jgi:twinkle protein
MPKQIAETYSKEVREYWDGRGIDIKRPLSHRVYEFTMAGKPILGFPTYMSQTLVDVKYLDIRWKKGQDSPKWWNLKKEYGTMSLPWGIDKLNFVEGEKKVVTITEGHVDALTWEQCEYKNIISVPSGAPSVEATKFEHEFDYLTNKYVQSVLADVELFILSTDGDAPGIKLRNHIALILGKEKCKYIQYPVGYKDINEVYKGVNKEDKKLQALGKTGVDECYQNLCSFPVKGIIRLADDREALELLASDGYVPGLKIGFKEIDDLYTTKSTRNEYFVGLPGSGKSTYVRWYITELIKNNPELDLKFAVFTPENSPISRERAKIAEVITGQWFRRGFKNSMNEVLREKVLWYIEKHFFFISPDPKSFEAWDKDISSDKVNTLRSIYGYLSYLKKTENIFGYVIDAWNKIDHEQPRSMSETTFISKQLDYVADFNRYYDLHGTLIVHPTKIEKIGINFRMPNLYDAKGSSAWKEKADVGLIGHRYMLKKKHPSEIPENATDDEKYEIDNDAPFILHNEKTRFEEEGKQGFVKLKLNRANGGRFELWKRPEIKEIPGKLNPKPKEEDDEVFGMEPNKDTLPF